MSIDLCNQGVPTLWGSFEIQNHRLAKMMMSQKANVPLVPGNFNEIADQFEELPLYFLKFHGATDVTSVLDAMDHAVYVYDVEHVILDNLQFMLGAGSSKYDRFEAQDHAIQSFRKFATKMNVHITLAVHPRKENDEMLGITSVFGSAKVTQEADNVILVQCLDRDRLLRTINVQKNRFDGDSGHVPFKFDKASRRIIEMTPREFEEARLRVAESGGLLGGAGGVGGGGGFANRSPTPEGTKKFDSPQRASPGVQSIPTQVTTGSILHE
jgi:twinkle protein